MNKLVPPTLFAVAVILSLAGIVTAAVYGNKLRPDGTTKTWLTEIDPKMGADFEIPENGKVKVHVEGKELIITSMGDKEAPRSLVVRGVVVNQLRIGFEK